MMRAFANSFGCCGVNWNSQKQFPVTLFGLVESEEEANTFIEDCKKQEKEIREDYKGLPPVYWKFKVDDKNYLVFYTMQDYQRWPSVYKTPQTVTEKLERCGSLEPSDVGYGWKVVKTYANEVPLDKYLSAAEAGKGIYCPINVVSGFSFYSEALNTVKTKSKKGLNILIVHYQGQPGSIQVMDWLRKETIIHLESEFQNSVYTHNSPDPKLNGHLLRLFIYEVK